MNLHGATGKFTNYDNALQWFLDDEVYILSGKLKHHPSRGPYAAGVYCCIFHKLIVTPRDSIAVRLTVIGLCDNYVIRDVKMTSLSPHTSYP